jgi:hypothetical protein
MYGRTSLFAPLRVTRDTAPRFEQSRRATHDAALCYAWSDTDGWYRRTLYSIKETIA